MERFKALEVYFDTRKVGTLATYQNRITAFEYSQQWLNNGFSISPFSLPLQKKLFLPKYEPFDGLYGVFADSLPDGWGRLLVDRLLLQKQMDPHTVDMLNRRGRVCQDTFCGFSKLNDLSVKKPPKTSCLQMS